MTKKYRAALETGKALGLETTERTGLYSLLLEAGYNWEPKSGTWDKNNPYMGSIFENYEGTPTGRFRLRLMCHPDELDEIEERLTEAGQAVGLHITSDNERAYQNRRGVGVRVYLDGQLYER